jgi:hypothetical protein
MKRLPNRGIRPCQDGSSCLFLTPGEKASGKKTQEKRPGAKDPGQTVVNRELSRQCRRTRPANRGTFPICRLQKAARPVRAPGLDHRHRYGSSRNRSPQSSPRGSRRSLPGCWNRPEVAFAAGGQYPLDQSDLLEFSRDCQCRPRAGKQSSAGGSGSSAFASWISLRDRVRQSGRGGDEGSRAAHLSHTPVGHSDGLPGVASRK